MNDIPKPRRPVFCQPVSMFCSSAQIKFIYKPLVKLGYQINDVLVRGDKDALCTCYFGNPICAGTSEGISDWNRVHLTEYNHRCFLAVAAMTRGSKYIPGEYCKIGENIFQVDQVDNLNNLLYVCEVNQWVPLADTKKPTLIELTTFFKTPYVGWPQQLPEQLPQPTAGNPEPNPVQSQ
jgi:hypothetical protein